MRVLLITPTLAYSKKPVPTWMPLGVATIAAVLRQAGHHVSIFDRYAQLYRLGNDTHKINAAMLAHIGKIKPDLIGLKTISPVIFDPIKCVSLIRSIYTGPIVAGGHHVTALPALSLQKIPELNGVIEGEGEFPLTSLANGNDPDTIPGLWWQDSSGEVHSTPPQQIDSLDQLPFPAFDLLDMAFYTRSSVSSIRGRYLSVVSIITSRGCLKQCEFCAESLTYGQGVRYHSPEYVMKWITEILNTYEVEGIYFFDNDFLIDRKRAERICDLFISKGFHRKLKWAIQARADRIDPEILRCLKRAGCVLIEFGIESARQQNLNAIKKQSNISTSERAIAMCRRAGIPAHAYMIAGFEGDINLEIARNLRWLKRNMLDSFSMGRLKIYPGTKLYRRLGDQFFEEHDWNTSNLNAYYNDTLLPEFRTKKDIGTWLKFRLYQTGAHTLFLFKSNELRRFLILLFERRHALGLSVVNFFKLLVKYHKSEKCFESKQTS